MRNVFLFLTIMVLALMLNACQPTEVEVTRVVTETETVSEEVEVTRVVTEVVTETVIEEGETLEVTRIVEVEPEVEMESIELVIWTDAVSIQSNAEDENGNPQFLLAAKQIFEAEHPGVTVVYEDHGWDEVLRQNLTTALLAGTAPDVIVGELYFQNYAALDALLPMNDVLDDVIDNIVPGTYGAAKFGDTIYGLSSSTGVYGLQRNCAVVEAAGLDCDTPPTTWDELLAHAQQITEAGNGEYYGFTMLGTPSFFLAAPFYLSALYEQAGSSMCNEDCTQPVFNHSEAVAVLEFARELNKTTPPGLTFEPDQGKLFDQLNQGVTAYQIAGSWFVNWAIDQGCEDCRYSSIPIPDGGIEASTLVANVMYAPLSASEHPELAREFVKLIGTRDEVQDLAFSSIGRLPVTYSALEALRPTLDPATQQFLDVLVTSDNLVTPPQFATDPQKIWGVYTELLDKLYTTDTPAEQLMDEAQEQVEALITE